MNAKTAPLQHGDNVYYAAGRALSGFKFLNIRTGWTPRRPD